MKPVSHEIWELKPNALSLERRPPAAGFKNTSQRDALLSCTDIYILGYTTKILRKYFYLPQIVCLHGILTEKDIITSTSFSAARRGHEMFMLGRFSLHFHDLRMPLGRYLLIQNTGDIYPYPNGSSSPATGSGMHTNQIHHRITVSYTSYLNRRLGIKTQKYICNWLVGLDSITKIHCFIEE
ncbi:hypothetical protein I7I48_01299 [Histoplasma ohiense]|nr:hypothetical protein I7I48_01299 [Histoplasma ohiense (nom. inval.)]